MMKVVGEEGTSIDDFVDYLKGDFFDDVYLQQNAFDKTDEATASERQKYVFDIISEIMDQDFSFDDKDSARKFFQELRQIFINWNSCGFDTDEFKKQEEEIKNKIANA